MYVVATYNFFLVQKEDIAQNCDTQLKVYLISKVFGFNTNRHDNIDILPLIAFIFWD
jgi:hypothetical protein